MNEWIGTTLTVPWPFLLEEIGTANFIGYFALLSIELPNNQAYKEKPVTQCKLITLSTQFLLSAFIVPPLENCYL